MDTITMTQCVKAVGTITRHRVALLLSLASKYSFLVILAISGITFSVSEKVQATPADAGIDYDIVYVRYPAENPTNAFVTIPQGEKPYEIAAGADLMLLHPDGTEDTLIDCTTCSVMDPMISFDAKTVYYSLIEEATLESAGAALLDTLMIPVCPMSWRVLVPLTTKAGKSWGNSPSPTRALPIKNLRISVN